MLCRMVQMVVAADTVGMKVTPADTGETLAPDLIPGDTQMRGRRQRQRGNLRKELLVGSVCSLLLY